MFKMQRPVTYSEVGPGFVTDMAQVINYFQDCSCAQSDVLGVGPEALDENGKVWILNSWQIVVDRYPKYNEEITVGTWAYDFTGLLGLRNYVIDDAEGNRIVRADSVWAMIDLKSGRLARISKEQIDAYDVEEKEPMDYAGRKIRYIKDHFETVGQVRVTRACLDTNKHMNNGRYVAIAMEYLPEDFKIRQMRAEYKKPAFYNEELILKRQIDEDKITILLENTEGEICVITEFME